ncbi:hypothetical protein OG250_28880 [Streptomyces sp. NBC_00487]|uniref:hypothetical protein n=1 Tax=unclassified Streptomyces TaxID=2593676 RepID=UPI002E19398C|nr:MULTISPECIES: hypothetical protein [unclassified Streptomyces]
MTAAVAAVVVSTMDGSPDGKNHRALSATTSAPPPARPPPPPSPAPPARPTSLPRGDLLEQWQKKEKSTSQGPGYDRIRPEETEFRGEPAVVWEYTVTAQELPWHVRSLGFDTGGKSYQLTTWCHPDIEDRALPVYEKVEKTFTPFLAATMAGPRDTTRAHPHSLARTCTPLNALQRQQLTPL